MLGKMEDRRRRGGQDDEMAEWHHRLDVCEFKQALGVGDGQGSLVCCSPWGHKELNTTEQLNLAEKVLEALSLISLRGSRNHLKSQPFFLLHRVLILGDEKSFCRNV